MHSHTDPVPVPVPVPIIVSVQYKMLFLLTSLGVDSHVIRMVHNSEPDPITRLEVTFSIIFFSSIPYRNTSLSWKIIVDLLLLSI